MDDPILDAPAVEESELRYAGFIVRLAASIIDCIIVFVVLIVIAVALTSASPFVIPLVVLCPVAYHVFLVSSAHQATIGKMLVGIKVGRQDGGRVNWLIALVRFAAKAVSLMTVIGYLMAGWDRKKQALHDRIAGTYVFHDMPKQSDHPS